MLPNCYVENEIILSHHNLNDHYSHIRYKKCGFRSKAAWQKGIMIFQHDVWKTNSTKVDFNNYLNTSQLNLMC